MPFIPDGCAAVRGSAIFMVGTTSELQARYPEAEFIDAKADLSCPGSSTPTCTSTAPSPEA